MDDIQKLRLIILGGENTGKTSLTHSILEGSILEIAHETENLDSYQNISLSDRNNYEHVHLNNTISLDMNCSINSDTKNNNNLLEHEENNNNTIINDKSDSNESKQTLYNQTTNNINNQYNNNIEVSEFNIESSSLKSSKNNSNINNNKTLSTQDSENVDKSAHLNFYSNNKDSNNNNNSDSVSGSRKKDSNTSIGSLTFNQNKNNKNNDQHQNYYSQRTIEYKLQTYKVTLYDSVFLTSASNELTGIKTISDYQGFILVFSLDDELSFETIQHINQVLTSKVGFKYVPRVLVGNKSDLPCVIDKERIKKLKKKLLCPYVECSVKEGKNLDKVLIKILKEINKEYKDEHPYDIVNSNREMNFISQDAYFWRKLLNLLFIVIMVSATYYILFNIYDYITASITIIVVFLFFTYTF